MKYKYEDTFVEEIETVDNKSHDLAMMYSMIARRLVVVFIICLGLYLWISTSKVAQEVIEPCNENLSINNCFVIGTDK